MLSKDNSMTYEIKTVHPKRGTWQAYDSTDGLPAGVICLLEDRQGYLWLGTEAGLCHYNGVELSPTPPSMD